ncbi:MAG: TIGR00266 family protein [Candidatus Brocadiae bacterium]|nr:TIGR00266 family protein [Candidatus Brocadiia bacterium]
MQIEILNSPGNATAKVTLEGGEKLIAETGGMIAMSNGMQVTTSTKTKGGGGFLKGLKRMLAGESLFLNTFVAPSKGGEIFLAPDLIGDMIVYELDGTKELMVQGTSYVASDADVELDTSWQGFKSGFFSGESMFWLRLTGKGQVILNSFGGIFERTVGDQGYIVDTGHIVAFENTLKFNVQKAAKTWFSSFMGGEMLVCRFQGKGRLFCQTHHPNNFGRTLGPLLKPR